MNTQFRTADGKLLHFEKSAEVVKYGGQSLKSVLDSLNNSNISEYGRKLLKAQDADELRRLLQVRPPEFYDEADGAIWRKIGNPTLSTANAKSGKALQASGSNYLRGAAIFGGDPFTLSFWAYTAAPSLGTAVTYFDAGDISVYKQTNNTHIFFNPGAVSGIQLPGSLAGFYHYEIGYNAGRLYYFVNGVLKGTNTTTIGRGAKAIRFLNGSFDEFWLSDGICRHTANFSVQTPALDSYTISLLRFN